VFGSFNVVPLKVDSWDKMAAVNFRQKNILRYLLHSYIIHLSKPRENFLFSQNTDISFYPQHSMIFILIILITPILRFFK